MNKTENASGAVSTVDNHHSTTLEAWDWLQNNQSLDSGIRPSNYLPYANIGDIADAIGRSLDLNEVRMMVVPDGDRVACAICNRTFQPVRYLVATDKLLQELLQIGSEGVDLASVLNEGLWRGSFFSPIGREPFAVCGSPFKFDPQTRRVFHPEDSHLVVAFRTNIFADRHGEKEYPHWGVTREKAEQIHGARLARLKDWENEKRQIADTASRLFSRRNGHGYRGQGGKTARREEKRLTTLQFPSD